MYWSLLSLKPFARRYLPLLLLTFVSAAANLPLKAQSLETVPSIQIGQASDEAKNQVLEQKAAQIIDLLSQQEYAQARELVHPDLASQLPTEQIATIWQGLLEVTGSVQKQVNAKVINTPNADLVIVETEFANTTGDFIVTFNQDQQIVGVDFPKVETIDQIAEIVVNSVAANDFPKARGYLHPFLKTDIFPQQVEQKWQNLLQQTGPFTKIVDVEVRPGSTVDQVDVVLVTIEFEKVTDDMLVIFDDARRIVNIDFPETE